jgi:LysM repeat protein
MARRLSAVQLEERAKLARAKEAARLQKKQTNPKEYRERNNADYQIVYYKDIIEPDRILQITVKTQAITNIGGLVKAGLLAAAPANSAVTEINKGSKIPLVKVKWYFGDSTSVIVPPSATNGRWVKKYDVKNGQSHWSLPYSLASGTLSLEAIITKFVAAFKGSAATDKEVLGAKGYAELVIGYGNNHVTLATSK